MPSGGGLERSCELRFARAIDQRVGTAARSASNARRSSRAIAAIGGEDAEDACRSLRT
jgi:hypothetical protein